MPSILHAHGSVIEHQGVVGFVIHDKISPSFRDGMYPVTTAFTASDLLATVCDCKAGAEKQSKEGGSATIIESNARKHLCIHCLLVIYKLMILLMDGLAEHALIEFSSCFGAHEEWYLDGGERDKLKESILTLMDAAGFNGDNLLQDLSPQQLLQTFAIGTERGKNKLPIPPDPAMLGPIHFFNRELPEEKAKAKLKMKEEKLMPLTDANVYQSCATPDYLMTSWLCHAFSKKMGSEETFGDTLIVGYHLLDLCTSRQGTSAAAVALIDAALKPKISDIFVMAKARAHPTAKAAVAKRKSSVTEVTKNDALAPKNRRRVELETVSSLGTVTSVTVPVAP